MYNSVTLMGRLVKDPEIRYTQSGKCVAFFKLAVDRGFPKPDEEKNTDFIPIVAWEKLGENCGKYLSKGHRTFVEGRLQVRSYEANGQRKWVTEVVIHKMLLLEKKSSPQNQGDNDVDYSSFGKDVSDEEIPF